jgi:N-terminal half of MaoC dehydratase
MAVERFPVEEGSIMMFARAIGDPNPIYSDHEYAARTRFGAVLAPPTYVQASAQFDPDYPLRPKIGEPWFGSGRQPTGTPPSEASSGSGSGSDGDGSDGGGSGGGTGLHAEQHFTYHRPLVAGDVLSATTRRGDSWEKQGRSGKLLFSELLTEYRDQAGELVVTAKIVAVVTERPVEQGS